MNEVKKPPAIARENESRKKLTSLPKAASAVSEGLVQLFEQVSTDRVVGTWNHAFTSFFTKAVGLLREPTRRILRQNNPENTPIHENQAQRSIHELIAEGISLLQVSNPDIPLSYTESEGRFSLSDFVVFFNQIFDAVDLDQLKMSKTMLFNKVTRIHGIALEGKKVSEILVIALQNGFSYEEIRDLIKIKLPEKISSLMQQAEEDNLSDLSEGRTTGEHLMAYDQAMKFVNLEVEKIDEPISVSLLIKYFLVIADGRIDKALRFTAGFLKYMAREVIKAPNVVGVTWIQDHIKDEFSLDVPYHDLSEVEHPMEEKAFSRLASKIKSSFLGVRYKKNKFVNFDFSLLNRMGLPYHALHMVALLQDFSPEMIALMTNTEYLLHGSMHGWSKYLADLRIIGDLKTTESMLQEYVVDN